MTFPLVTPSLWLRASRPNIGNGSRSVHGPCGLERIDSLPTLCYPPLHSPTDWAPRSLSDIAFVTRRRRCDQMRGRRPGKTGSVFAGIH
jgi:hypothetical protein